MPKELSKSEIKKVNDYMDTIISSSSHDPGPNDYDDYDDLLDSNAPMPLNPIALIGVHSETGQLFHSYRKIVKLQPHGMKSKICLLNPKVFLYFVNYN